MEPLSDDERHHIDDLIFDENWLRVTRLYRHKLGGSINSSVEFIDARAQELRKQFPERFPNDADRSAAAVERLRDVSAKETVTAIVATWDGDTRGWFIELCAQTITTAPGTCGWGLCQLREIERQVERAVELGTRLADSLNVPFHLDNSDGPYS